MAEKTFPTIVVKYGDLYFDMVPRFEIKQDVLKQCSNRMPDLLKGVADILLPMISVSYDDKNNSVDVAHFANPFFDNVELTKFRKGTSYHSSFVVLSQKDFMDSLNKIHETNPEEKFSYVGVGLAKEK